MRTVNLIKLLQGQVHSANGKRATKPDMIRILNFPRLGRTGSPIQLQSKTPMEAYHFFCTSGPCFLI